MPRQLFMAKLMDRIPAVVTVIGEVHPVTDTPTITPTSTITPTPTITYTPTFTPSPTVTLPAVRAASCVPVNTGRTEAKVTRVIDGDTIEVSFGGQVYSVRYIGIDTPEYTTEKEYYGYEATQRNKDLVLGKTVVL